MNNSKNNFNQNNNPHRPDVYDLVIMGYIMLNGAATGHSIRLIRQLINTDIDTRNTILALLVSVGAAIISGQRAYEVYKNKKNQHNQNQR